MARSLIFKLLLLSPLVAALGAQSAQARTISLNCKLTGAPYQGAPIYGSPLPAKFFFLISVPAIHDQPALPAGKGGATVNPLVLPAGTHIDVTASRLKAARNVPVKVTIPFTTKAELKAGFPAQLARDVTLEGPCTAVATL
jgi:hypothetical protein